MIRVEDCFNLQKLVGIDEINFGQIPPTKYERKIYAIIMNNRSTATNRLLLRQYAADGTTLEVEWAFEIGAIDTIDIVSDKESPILNIPAGCFLKTVASAASIQLVLSAYDI